MDKSKKLALMAYAEIIAVVVIWGLIPSAKKALIGDSFSASVYSAITTFSGACCLLFTSWRQLKLLNRSYFKVAVPTGVCVGAGALAQALAYNFDASPTNQAFLENLSCVVVPIILFIIIKKKPTPLLIVASALCLASSAVLAGVFDVGLNFRVADVLNAVAGVFYGINIAFTGVYAKKFVAPLYVMIQLFVQAAFSAVLAVVLNYLKIGGEVVDPFAFTPNPMIILAVFGIGIITNSVCWTLRTTAMKHVSASVVAVIMPFSAVITGVFAVMVGQDKPTYSLLVGAVLGLAAGVLSAIGDREASEKG